MIFFTVDKMGVVKDIYLILLLETVLVSINLQKIANGTNRGIPSISTWYFIECSVGYIGNHCSLPCPYPSYGKGCQKFCSCRKDECIFNLGCEEKLKGIYVSFQSFFRSPFEILYNLKVLYDCVFFMIML